MRPRPPRLEEVSRSRCNLPRWMGEICGFSPKPKSQPSGRKRRGKNAVPLQFSFGEEDAGGGGKAVCVCACLGSCSWNGSFSFQNRQRQLSQGGLRPRGPSTWKAKANGEEGILILFYSCFIINSSLTFSVAQSTPVFHVELRKKKIAFVNHLN